MKRAGSMVILFVLVAVMSALSPAIGGDRSDLAGRVETWEEMFNGGNAEGVAALYTEDAIRLPYQAAMIKGRAEIADNIWSTYDGGVTKIKLALSGAESRGSPGWGHGT